MTDLAAAPRFTWRAPALLRVGVVASLLFLLLGFVSIVWTPYPVTAVDVGAAMQDPGGAHWLGTDQLGRDVLSLAMKGTLTSFVVSAVAVAIGALIGILLGLAAAAWGRIANIAVGGVSAYLAALPTLVVAILLAALFGPSAATVMVAVGIGNIAAFALTTRDAMRTANSHGYVEAARLAGSSGLDLIRRHTLPSILRAVLAQGRERSGFGRARRGDAVLRRHRHAATGHQPRADAARCPVLRADEAGPDARPGSRDPADRAGAQRHQPRHPRARTDRSGRMALLKVENLTVTQRGVPLLEDISFAIGKGQRLGVIGEAGSGKTLLALAVLGLLPTGTTMTGSIGFDDKPMPSTEAELAQLRGKRIGAVLEGAADALAPLKTIGAQLDEALRRAGASGDLPARAAELLRDVGLDAKVAIRHPRDLTLPERQRVMFAIAIAAKPDLLIVDEPAAGLDLIGQRRILDLINKLCTEHNLSLLVVSHDLKTVAMLATKIVVLRGGKVIEAGEKPEVFGHPKHEFTRAMLSAGRHRARTLMRTPIGGTLLELRNVSRRFRSPDRSLFEPQAPVVALDDVSFSAARRRVARGHRPSRLGQVDADPDHRRARARDLGRARVRPERHLSRHRHAARACGRRSATSSATRRRPSIRATRWAS